jgi:amino acid transporter
MSEAGSPRLPQALSLRDVVFFFISAVLSIRWIASAAAAGPSSIVIWIIALATFFLPLALISIRLAALLPGEGGVYLWTRTAFGDAAGFLTGWTYWTSNVVYFPSLLYFAAGTALYVWPERMGALSESPLWFIGFSLGALAVATGLNVIGLRYGKWLHTMGTVATWFPVTLLLVGAVVLFARSGSATPFTAASMVPATGLRDIVFWSSIAFAFGGFEAASLMGSEVRDSRRTIPRAIVVAGVIVTLVYVSGTLAVLVALPQSETSSLQGLTQALQAIVRRLGLGGIDRLMALLIAVSSIGGVGAWLAASSRLPFVAGIDRLLPKAFGKLHPRWGTPWVALLVQSAIAAVMTLIGQAGATVKTAYDILVSLTVIAYFIPFLFMFASALKLLRGGVVSILAVVGFATTGVSIILACLPAAGDPSPAVSVAKIVGLSAINVLVALVIYATRRRALT